MPKVVDHEQRRTELADAALDIVAEHGIKAVTVKAVAERSGWSTGVINHYFRSHHELLVGALRRAADIQGRQFRQLRSDPDTSAIERLSLLFESILPLDARRIAMTRIFLVFYAEAAANPDAREEVVDYLHNWRRVVERIVAAAQAAGELPADVDPAAQAIKLVGLADGVAIHTMLDPDLLKTLADATGSVRLRFSDGQWGIAFPPLS
jgi:AcrR family transcriptional regulator